MNRYADTLRDQNGRPIEGASVYVYHQETEELAALEDDGGGALGNPVTTDSDGNYYFNVDTDLYILDYRYLKRQVLRRELVPIGPVVESVLKGDRGDPGPSLGDIGAFVELGDVEIPEGVNIVRTSSYEVMGSPIQGRGATLMYSPAVNDAMIAAHPRFCGKDSAGRGFFMTDTEISPAQIGARDCSGTPRGADEVVYDNADVLNDLVAWIQYRGFVPALDTTGMKGVGTSQQIVIDSGQNGAWWNSAPIRIKGGGRIVAMAKMDEILWFKNKSYEIEGAPVELFGGTDAQTSPGYSSIFAKNGVKLTGAATTSAQGFKGQGFRRFGVQIDKSANPTTNNNIPLSFDRLMFVQSGSRGTGTGATAAEGFGGSYSAGQWFGTNGSVDQYHRMTLTPAAGVDVDDLEVGDPLRFNNYASEGWVHAIVSKTATTVTVDVRPWQPIEASGNFVSMHGGTVSAGGTNLANSRFGLVYSLVNGTAIQVFCEYAPVLTSLLSENTQVSIQMVGNVNEPHIEGFAALQYHLENIDYAIMDCITASTGCVLGAVSNLAGTAARGKFGLMRRLSPGNKSGSTWLNYNRQALRGWSIQMDGGIVNTGSYTSIRKQGRQGYVGNRPSDRDYGWADLTILGSGASQTITFDILIDKAIAEITQNNDHFGGGPIHANGTDGKIGGNMGFQITTEQPGQDNITINGSTSPLVIAPPASGAWMWRGRYVPNDSGGGGDVRIVTWTVKL